MCESIHIYSDPYYCCFSGNRPSSEGVYFCDKMHNHITIYPESQLYHFLAKYCDKKKLEIILLLLTLYLLVDYWLFAFQSNYRNSIMHVINYMTHIGCACHVLWYIIIFRVKQPRIGICGIAGNSTVSKILPSTIIPKPQIPQLPT